MPQPSSNRPEQLEAVAARRFLQVLQIGLLGIAVLALLMTGYLLQREATWLPLRERVNDKVRNEQAFFHGTIGTEVVPLPVLLVLPELTADPKGGKSHFYPFGASGGSWIEQFGFLDASKVPSTVPGNPLTKGLPLGFTVSNYRPKSGAPSPVLFVGLACATCHTTEINGHLVVGTGNSSLNLFAWIDAFQAALRDPRVSYDSILTAYERKGNPPLTLEEKLMIRLWLSGATRKLAEDVTHFDEPFGNGESVKPSIVPTGPARTQPFRTLVRTMLQRPGADMKVYTKIAAIYREQKDEWGQFDGGIHGLYRRSAGAALAAGATPQNMSLPEIADNIRWASDHASENAGPAWNDVFPNHRVDSKSPAHGKGKEVYLRHCHDCHGHPENGQWVNGNRVGQREAWGEIGTDPERVTFREYEGILDALPKYFPKGNPFDFPREELYPPPDTPVEQRGFINKPMHAMFTRAPFLHNASILTLAELIHLEPRKAVFYRGANEYDPARVGLRSPTEKEHEAQPHLYRKLYFRFDTSLPGNSNRGHDWPWPRDQVESSREKQQNLRDLLEYLKTL